MWRIFSSMAIKRLNYTIIGIVGALMLTILNRGFFNDIRNQISLEPLKSVIGERVRRLQDTNSTSEMNKTTIKLEKCAPGRELVGPLYVDRDAHEWESMEHELNFVTPGGKYAPKDCLPNAKVAIVVPYRDREKHLRILLKQIHPVLRRQLLHYQVFVIEQADANPFNRGKLMNVGFIEAMKRGDFNCFIFHDIDLLPEDDRNYYDCHISPAHMSVAVDIFSYQLLYDTLFGGVVMFKKEDFLKVNGFSNVFWGWGGEDDNLYQRIGKSGLWLKRPAINIARYTMLKHKESPKNENRHKLLDEAFNYTDKDGVNSLGYLIKDSEIHQYYTKISVDLLRTGQ